MARFSLGHRIAAVIVVLQASTLILAVWLGVSRSLQGSQQQIDRVDRVRIAGLADMARGAFITGEYDLVMAELRNLKGDQRIINADIVDRAGRVVASTNPLLLGHQAIAREPGAMSHWQTAQVRVASQVVGEVAVRFSDTDLAAARTAAWRQAGAIGGAGLLVTIAVALLLGRLLTRRLDQLVVTSQRLASGDIAARTGLAGSDEIARLGTAFDDMAEVLQRREQEMVEGRAVLAEHEGLLRTVIEMLPLGVWLIGADGRIASGNQQAREIWGGVKKSGVGQYGEYKAWWPDTGKRVEAHEWGVARALRGGEHSINEIMDIEAFDGRRKTIAHWSAPIRDGDGRITGAIAVNQDITERKQAEQAREKLEAQLLQAQKLEALGTLAGGIAHDFNNLLAAILGNVTLARQDAAVDSPVQHNLVEIERAAKRARDLVRQILTFSRRQPLERRVISFREVAQEAVELLRATLPTGIELVTTFAPDTPNVLADRTQMHQLLMNLCVNAWHAMEGNTGRIEVALAEAIVHADSDHLDLQPGRYARLSVADTGRGMDAVTVKRIFDPFFTTKSVGEGTGLGLAVVDGMVKGHGGAIAVESEPGRGSAFHVYIPAAAAGSVVHADTAPSASRPGHGQRILYLDDEEALVLIAQAMLQRLGYQPHGYTLPAQALEAFESDPAAFDLLVTDFNMPGSSGLEVAARMLRLRPNLPIALASGLVTDELCAQALALGIHEVLAKPHTIEQLAAALQRMLTQPE